MEADKDARCGVGYPRSERSALAATLLVVMGVSACAGTIAPRHDYPSEYPAAPVATGACPDLSGVFENAGMPLQNTPKTGPRDPTWLASLMLAPGSVPATAKATALQIRGPAQGTLQIEAIAADGAVAHSSSMTNTSKADGFVHSKPYAQFLCDWYQGGADVVLTNDPVTVDGTKYEVAVRIYRATDGSLVVAKEEVYTDLIGEANVWRQWFRFPQSATR